MFIGCRFTSMSGTINSLDRSNNKKSQLQTSTTSSCEESISGFSLNLKIQSGLHQLPMLDPCAMVVNGSGIVRGWAQPQELLQLWHETKHGAEVQQRCCWEAWLLE